MNITTYILIGFFVDMVLTYLFIRKYRSLNPNRDWAIIEQNPIVRYCFRNFGLNAGMIVGALSVLILLVGLLRFVFVEENMRYFLMGVYCMMIIFHYLNFRALAQIKVKEEK